MNQPNEIIIHWNCNGLKTRHHNGELKRLVRQYNPIALCLQHTNHTLNAFDQYNLATSYTQNDKELGTAIYVHKKIAYQNLKTQTLNVQASLVKIFLNNNMYIILCNMYNQPSCKYNLNTIQKTIKNQKNVLLVGDFNSHSPLWNNDNRSSDHNGKLMEKLIENNNLNLLNDPEIRTYFSRTHSTFSSIDLSICTNDIVDILDWSVSDDDYTSDHYPVLISVATDSNASSIERFNTDKAVWQKFTQLTNAIYPYQLNQEHNETYENLTKFIIDAAHKSIPLTKAAPVKKAVPWWNEHLAFLKETKQKLKRKLSLINKRVRSLNRNNINLELDKIIDIVGEFGHVRKYYNKVCALFKRAILNSKKESRETYIRTITERTPIRTVWKKYRKINGKGNSTHKCPLKYEGKIIYEDKDIANAIGTNLQTISSNENLDPSFVRTKNTKEKEKINLATKESKYYNEAFTVQEFEYALKNCKSTAPGMDKISFEMLKHLGAMTKSYILRYYNQLWENHLFPEAWRHAIVVPVPKPGKDPSDPTNYRPISLTSSLCKLMEKIVNNRLNWYLKKNKLITATQFGSIKNRSTLDSLTNIEFYIRKNFKDKKITGALFFDKEKAYDTSWRHRILKELHKFDLRGHLPRFIENFLQKRTFQVKYNNVLSDNYHLINGIPQGSVLSCTLFLITINDVVKQLPKKVRNNLYVDDFGIYYSSKCIRHLQRILNQAGNKVNQWCKAVGLKLAISKTQGILFYRNIQWLKNNKIKSQDRKTQS